jgi:hypothetical protein
VVEQADSGPRFESLNDGQSYLDFCTLRGSSFKIFSTSFSHSRAGCTGLRIGTGRIDALKGRFSLGNGTLHTAKYPT